MSIVCVGSVALDSVSTPSGKREEALGGAATYFSAAASLFTHVDVVAVVGEDFPEKHLAFLKEKGVGLSGLERRAGRTFRWTGEYGYDLNEAKTLKTELNVFETFRPEVPAPLRKSEWLFLGNIDPKLQLDVLNQIEKPRLIAADTMNYWINDHLESLKKVLARIDLLFINDAEARQLVKTSNIVKAARAIQAMGPKIVCIKRGEYGAMLFLPVAGSLGGSLAGGAPGHGKPDDAADIFAIPAMPLTDVQDPTGAGDSFAGGFFGSLVQHVAAGEISPAALRRAAVYGTVLASFAVERFGLERVATLTRPEIEQRFLAFGNLTWQSAVAASTGTVDKAVAGEHA